MSTNPQISLFPLLVLLLLIPNSYSSGEGSHGYLEIRLKSPFPLNATVTITEDIYFPTNKRVYNVPLHPDRPEILTNIPVTFHRPGTVLVNSGPVDLFGLHYATIRSDRWNTKDMVIAPDKINLPFTGFRIDVNCDKNWDGPYCDKYCNYDHAKLINRFCTSNGTLACPHGFRGPNCDIPFDQQSMSHPCPCVNHGYCVAGFPNPLDTVDRLLCECGGGYEGDLCEQIEYNYADAVVIEMHGTSEKFELLKKSLNGTTVRNELRVLSYQNHPDYPFNSFYEH
ncbi:unnamed protein product [Caenorhabditis nigoni]